MSPHDINIDKNYILEKYIESCETLTTTKIYAEWSLYSLLATCMERRHWIQVPGVSDKSNIYPSLYVMLVGPSGIGKTVAVKSINSYIFDNLIMFEKIKAGDVIKATGAKRQPALHTLPTSTTPEGMIHLMARKFKKSQILTSHSKDKHIHTPEYVGASIIADEISVLFKDSKFATNNMLSFLTKAYDQDRYENHTKGEGSEVIERMCINILGGTTPEHLQRLFSSTSVKEGLGNRFIYVWSGKSDWLHVYHKHNEKSIQFIKDFLLPWCSWLVNNVSICSIGPGVEELSLEIMKEKRDNPPNKHAEAASLYQRYNIHLQKLAIIRHFLRSKEPVITVEDIEDARHALEKIEPNIHLCFSELFSSQGGKCLGKIEKLLGAAENSTLKKGQLRLELIKEGFSLQEIDQTLEVMMDSNVITSLPQNRFKLKQT